jgi:hypothetical protein
LSLSRSRDDEQIGGRTERRRAKITSAGATTA